VPVEHEVRQHGSQLRALPRPKGREALHRVVKEIFGAGHGDEYRAVANHPLRRYEYVEQGLRAHRAPR
jgi:hypothetical protein